jgi:hypothetical protein
MMDYRLAYLKTLETPKKKVVINTAEEAPKSQSLLTQKKKAHNM